MRVVTVARNALRPGYFGEMVRKVRERVWSREDESSEATQWAAERAVDIARWARAINPELWTESEAFATKLEAHAAERQLGLEAAGVTMGGGGAYALLYFLTRHLAPANVL